MTDIVFETDRLILRRFRKADFEDLRELNSFESTFKYEFVHPLEDYELEDYLLEVIQSYQYEEISRYEYAVELLSEKKLIGIFTYDFQDPLNYVCEIGGWLNENYWGQGFALEIAKKAVEYILSKGAKKIFCSTEFQNTKAVQLIEKIGFKKEGHVKMATWVKDKYFDEVLYGIMADDHKVESK